MVFDRGCNCDTYRRQDPRKLLSPNARDEQRHRCPARIRPLRHCPGLHLVPGRRREGVFPADAARGAAQSCGLRCGLCTGHPAQLRRDLLAIPVASVGERRQRVCHPVGAGTRVAHRAPGAAERGGRTDDAERGQARGGRGAVSYARRDGVGSGGWCFAVCVASLVSHIVYPSLNIHTSIHPSFLPSPSRNPSVSIPPSVCIPCHPSIYFRPSIHTIQPSPAPLPSSTSSSARLPKWPPSSSPPSSLSSAVSQRRWARPHPGTLRSA